MSQPQTLDEVIAWADLIAKGDLERHRKYGVDLNPYSTLGARREWRRGFDNEPPHPWEDPTREFNLQFQRGRAMARLLKETT